MSPACTNCYAERDAVRRGWVKWGPEAAGGTRVVTRPENWHQPVKWARAAAAEGVRRLVFCASLSDVFEEWAGELRDMRGNLLVIDPGSPQTGGFRAVPRDRVPARLRPATLDDARSRLFRLMGATSYALDWLVLTKRPDVMLREWPRAAAAWEAGARDDVTDRPGATWRAYRFFQDRGLMPNVWAGVTAEDQDWADRRLPHLANVSAVRRFLSCEPLVGGLVLRGDHGPGGLTRNWLSAPDEPAGIHWVITGGESGPGARPAHPDWYRGLRDQCREAGTPFFFKQHGEWVAVNDATTDMDPAARAADVWLDGKAREPSEARETARTELPVLNLRVGKKAAGRLLDGEDWSQIPDPVL